MVQTIISKYFKIQGYSTKLQISVRNYISLSLFSNFSVFLSNTFYILYILDLIDFVQTGLLISIGFILQAIIDFPTGVLADWLGYRWVLFASYIGHFISFALIASISIIQPNAIFPFLVVAYSVESFSQAQESGALQSWFDTKYKQYSGEDDPDKSKYKEIYGMTLMFLRLIGALAIYLGGFLSDTISREFVFYLQALLSLVLAFMFLFLLTPTDTQLNSSISMREYNRRLLDGVRIIFKSRGLLFFFLTFVLIMTVNRVWTGLIVFPIYFGYTGTDGLASLLRGTLFLLGSVLTGYSTRFSKHMNAKRYLWRMFLLHAILVYGLYSILLFIFPISTLQSEAELQILPILIIFLIASYANFSSAILLTLAQRIMVDRIPDENRNSFYSLVPSVTLLVSSGVVVIVGNFIKSTGSFSLTIFLFIFIPVILCSILSNIAMNYFAKEDGIDI